jgi:hypothetical protein
MSTIIDDYLFRCPSWRFASGVAMRRKEKERNRREVRIDQKAKTKVKVEAPKLSHSRSSSQEERKQREDPGQKQQSTPPASPFQPSNSSNVYVYRFTQPTHVAGFPACWGLSCHTAELPYFFNSLDIIREEYSVRGKRGIEEAPVPPEYPYTEAMRAFRGELGNESNGTVGDEGGQGRNGKRGGKGGKGSEEEIAGVRYLTKFARQP